MTVYLFANNASTTVSSGGTDAPSAGTVETWAVASSSEFPDASELVARPTVCALQDPAAPTEIMLVTNVAATSLTSALVSGTAYTSLAVAALPQAMDSGDTLVVGMGATTQDVVLSASVAAGATSLSITSVTPTADFAVGTPVTDLTTPGANLDGSVWTVTRGAEGTTPVTHGSGFTVNNVVTAGSIPNNLVAPLELPATTSDPLTTQGGNTLDDGSGNAVVNGDLTIDTATIETEWRNPPGQTFGKISLSLANITGQNGILLKQTSVNPVDIETVTTHPGDVVTSIRHEPRPGFTIGPAIPEIQVGPPGAAWVGISSAGLFSVSHVNPNPALPALPTNPPVSGTVYQNTTGGPILIAVPVTGGSVADTAQWALGSTDTPADWGGADTVAIDEVKTIHLTVPNGWYWSLTTGATIGTADVLGS